MYTVSDDYKSLILADSTKHALKVYIDDVEIDSNYILDLSVSHVLFENDEFCFGSTPAKTVELKIHKNALPDTYKRIYIETGINKSSLTETVPIGYFNVDEISKDDDYTVTLSLIDDMSKFEFNYDGSELTYPATMLTILQDICDKAGIELGSTSFLNSDKEVSVYDSTVTARTYIGYIAEQAGGFAVIGRDGKLYIRQIGDNKIEFMTVEEVNSMTVTEVNALQIYKLSSENLYELNIKYFANYSWGEEFIVSRIAYEDGVQDFKTGDETNNTIWINSDNMYIVGQEQIDNIYNLYSNSTYYSFSGTSIVDPAWDVGDVIVIDGKNIIYQGTMDYKGKFKANIESDIQAKSKEETTTTTISEATKIRRVQSSIDQVEGTITQLVEEVSDNTEKISEHEQTIDSITDTVSSVETKVETAQTTADNAQASADTAQTTANTAVENAETALNTANTAIANSEEAQSTAENASTTASEALTTSATAVSTAEEAKTTAETAQTTADTANANSESAVATANTANENAESAITTANTANDTANEANTTAQNAQETANNAQNSADTAQETAQTAQDTAEIAQISAEKAQETANSAVTQITTTTTKLAEVEQTVDGIIQTVSSVEESITETQKVIDNLTVGARNLLLGTATQDTEQGNTITNATRTGETFLGCDVFKTSSAWASIGFNLKRVIEDNDLKVGDVLTYSIYNKTDEALSVAEVDAMSVADLDAITTWKSEAHSKTIYVYTSPRRRNKCLKSFR